MKTPDVDDNMNDKESKNCGKVIFNYLPPANDMQPSPAFSVLKGFLSHHHYECDVLYWNARVKNILMSHFSFAGISPDEGDTLQLLPFLLETALKYRDKKVLRRIKSTLLGMFPEYSLKINTVFKETLPTVLQALYRLIDSEIEKLRHEDILLLGFSAKFHQWIPAIMMAERFKMRLPHIKIAIGGFGNPAEAKAFLELSSVFDFALWGEGEYSLLELLKQIENFSGQMECDGEFESVSHLVYRSGNELNVSRVPGRYVDFNNYISPDYSDYFEVVKKANGNIRLFIESSRGCHWGRCKFCNLNKGYRYRRRTPESVVSEIEFISSRFNIDRFQILDNDAVGLDIRQFEKLLDLLIESSKRRQTFYNIKAEIVHKNFNARIINKMAIAGFTCVQIGYEAISDTLLEKIDKKTDFSDLILFVKFAGKYKISTFGSNIIRGIIGETADDVQESMENLPYLRFFLDKDPGCFKLVHHVINHRLEPDSIFAGGMSDEDKEKWDFHPTAYLLPDAFIGKEKRTKLFGFYRPLVNENEWRHFDKVNQYFQDVEFRYTLSKLEGIYYYREYRCDKLINYTVFDKPEYWDVLASANDRVTSLDEVFSILEKGYPGITKKRVKEIITDLKADYLLYANEDNTRMVSIIDAR